jgi:hypothetical protein
LLLRKPPDERQRPERRNELDHAFRELDDLVLHLKGLVLVRRFRERNGADAGELNMFDAEIERARERLAHFVTYGNVLRAAA